MLALLAFGDIAARHFGDLDLLVAERDYLRCGDLLVSRGFRRDQDCDYESSYVNETNNVCVDLHRSIADSWRWPVRLDFERLWERKTCIPVLGAPVPSFDLADLIIVLSVQLVRDTWARRVRISKIADLAQVTAGHKEIDWDRVEREADKAGCKRMVIFALRSANELLPRSHAPDLPRFVRGSRLAAIPLVYVRRHLSGAIRQTLAERLLRVGFELWTLRRLVDTEALRRLLGDKAVELLVALWRMLRLFGIK